MTAALSTIREVDQFIEIFTYRETPADPSQTNIRFLKFVNRALLVSLISASAIGGLAGCCQYYNEPFEKTLRLCEFIYRISILGFGTTLLRTDEVKKLLILNAVVLANLATTALFPQLKMVRGALVAIEMIGRIYSIYKKSTD